MTLGQIAGLIAALAAVALVVFLAVPLLKLGRVLDELRVSVRDLGQESVPILTELRGTVRATNEELSKLSVVTQDVAKVSANASLVSDNAAQLSTTFSETVGRPMVKTAALGYGLRRVVRRDETGRPRRGRRARQADLRAAMAEREAEVHSTVSERSADADPFGPTL